MKSADGINWIPCEVETTENFCSVTWTGRQLVAAGYYIYSSPDGITWTRKPNIAYNSLYSITWTGSLLVAVGYSGQIITSPEDVAAASIMPLQKKSVSEQMRFSRSLCFGYNLLTIKDNHSGYRYNLLGRRFGKELLNVNTEIKRNKPHKSHSGGL